MNKKNCGSWFQGVALFLASVFLSVTVMAQSPGGGNTPPMGKQTVISNPDVLVYFDRVGNTYCPVGTAFRADVKTSTGPGKVVLPTGVPLSAPGRQGDNKIFFVAIDNATKEPLAEQPAASKWGFALFFHPFQERDAFVSKWRPNPKVYAIGALKLRRASRLPEGVEYKYTVVTVTPGNDGKPVVDTRCKPLDPVIRVL